MHVHGALNGPRGRGGGGGMSLRVHVHVYVRVCVYAYVSPWARGWHSAMDDDTEALRQEVAAALEATRARVRRAPLVSPRPITLTGTRGLL
jgi:hypothetical protein